MPDEYIVRLKRVDGGWHWYVGGADGFAHTIKHAFMDAYAAVDYDLDLKFHQLLREENG